MNNILLQRPVYDKSLRNLKNAIVLAYGMLGAYSQ